VTKKSVSQSPIPAPAAWTPEEQARADRYQQESAALYRALRAALRREPTPRERFRAQEAFRAQMGGAS
jgi:hypothetical protein